jgi:hypothetical protein
MGLASIRLYFFVLVLCKMPQVVPKCPRITFAQNKKLFTHNVFWWLYDATSPHKNLVKNWGNELFSRMRFRSHFFPRQVQFLKAGAMGVVLAVSLFDNARPTQP